MLECPARNARWLFAPTDSACPYQEAFYKEIQALPHYICFDIAAGSLPLLRTVRIELDAGSRLGGFYGKTPFSGSHISSLARADVRVRNRPSVIRVRISETALRAVIRVAAPKQQLIPLYLPSAPVGVAPSTLPVHAFSLTCRMPGESDGF